MTTLFLLDVRVDPVTPVSWGGLIVLLAIILVLAVSLVAGLVLFLIWWKRRKRHDQQAQIESNPTLAQ
jgi:uncharacterized iron-regulated membrane protein